LLDPVIPPDRKEARDLVSSRAILNACRPYAWKDQFPPVNALRPELRKKIEEKWKSVLG
jgi:4-hydroxy-3-polyprenylbenzoate decarboxylase